MTTGSRNRERDAFEPAPLDALLGAIVHRHTALWVSLGNLESRMLADSLRDVRIDRPVFIAGLARSGTTILLELFSRFGEVCTHRYRDFPPVFTPFWWNWLVDHSGRRDVASAERAHGDRIEVSPESPEAFEEPIWMAHFPGLHDPARSNVLDSCTTNPAFERFYADHIRKMLQVRRADRYVSKGNYNIARLAYLRKLFPDARFVIPVREPVAHIASLMKQHALFTRAAGDNPKARNHLRWVGHFEFGADRVPIHMGDAGVVERILDHWARGEEVPGWALYWDHIYTAVADRLESDAGLAKASLIVSYEALCREPVETVSRILEHCGFTGHQEETDRFCEKVSPPTYYSWPFSEDDLTYIQARTGDTAGRFGLHGAELSRGGNPTESPAR